MSEKSDPDYVPDEAEPEDNVPDAVMDSPGAGNIWRKARVESYDEIAARVRETCLPEATHDKYGIVWVIMRDPSGMTFRSPLAGNAAVRFAHAILSEVEIAQREEGNESPTD